MNLSELIKACGDGFYSLIKRGDYYEAIENFVHGQVHRGKTPEEAMEKLYNGIKKSLEKGKYKD